METQMESIGIKNIKFNGFRIELTTNMKSQLVARVYKMLTAGKNKGREKILEGYYFHTEQKRDEWVRKTFNSLKERIKSKDEHKKTQQQARENFNASESFKVGEIYYDSWGYDQTNIDFYQILEVKEKSVVVQRIKSRHEGENGFMSNYVSPAKDGFFGEPELKIIQVRVWNGKLNVYIHSRHGWISKWDREKITESHYA